MKKNKPYIHIRRYGIWLWLMLTAISIHAQQETICSPFGEFEYDNTTNFVYGAGANSSSFTYRTDAVIGQPLVATQFPVATGYETVTGIYANFLLPASGPLLLATQGDFPDFVELKWILSPLSPSPAEFKIFRNGSFLTRVAGDITEFLDFNVQAGNIYEYKIIAFNDSGVASLPAFQTGFTNPNGVVSGQVRTNNGNPVPGATVTISPSFGNAIAFNGAGEHACVSWDNALNTSQWTVSTWVKMGNSHDGEGIIDLGSDLNKNWWIRATPTGDKGVIVGLGDGTSANEKTMLFADTPDDWHHVAVAYNGMTATLYLDGDYMGFVKGDVVFEPTRFSIGRTRDGSAYFEGSVDDVRIYNEALTQTEIIIRKDISESSRTESLLAYWKFDEGVGTTSFDITDRGLDAQIYGGTFTADAPELMNAGMTDVNGNYLIEGINYSQTSNFVVKPQKLFYDNYSLEFNAGNSAYATLPHFELPDTSSIEISFLPYDTETTQTILSKGEHFELYLNQGRYYLKTNSTSTAVDLGAASGAYEHLAITMNRAANEVIVYLNGSQVATFSDVSDAGTWSTSDWVIAAKDVANPSQYFTGLVDGFAVYDTVLLQMDVQLVGSLNPITLPESIERLARLRGHLVADFNFNESEGTALYDFGSQMLSDGVLHNGSYSIIARTQETTPHEFEPNLRNINLNYTSTSVTNVDFKDVSTVAISGVIRFEDTFCYQDSVEVLVNGSSYFPPIFTNSDGRFVADFEPGSNVTLAPRFGADSTAHEFFPAFYEVRRLNVPVANVLFQNTTKREVSGQLFGGVCRKSIIPVDENGDATAIVRVKLFALNGCYEEVKLLDDQDGKFDFRNVPPIPVAVSVIEHSNTIIYDYFQIAGGTEIDLRDIEKDTVDFMYVSPPVVELSDINSGLVANDCNLPLIYDSQKFARPKLYSNNVRVYQDYAGGKCYLDTFSLIINNGIQESIQENISSDTSTYVYEWYANNPNLLAPHTKTLQVVAEVNNLTASALYTAVVLGERQQESTISTTGPSEVFAVVHDPPGDASYATWTEGTRTCTTWESASVSGEDEGASRAIKLGNKFSVGVGTETEFEVSNTTTLSGSFEKSETNTNSAEFCFETIREISTSDGDDIWGDYGDVYFGAAMNFEIGARDVLDYDFDNCAFTNDIVLSIAPAGFATDFVYSRWQIETEVIPQLDSIIAQGVSPGVTQAQIDAARVSKNKWKSTLARTQLAKDGANYGRNITFDAAASYTETVTTELTGTHTFSTTLSAKDAVQNEFGYTVGGFGDGLNLNFGWSQESTDSEGNSVANTVTTSFTLADDDLNDFYSVDIASDYKQLDADDLAAYEEIISNIGDGETGEFDFTPSNAPFSHTPIFKVKGGESMCPWIPGTRNREEVSVLVEAPVQTNVSANTPAIYNITLGNIGPNGVDGLVYQLGVRGDGNPDGALITIDGTELVGLNAVVPFQFVGTESIEKQIAVEVGTSDEFNFPNLGLYFGSTCQIDHSLSVGYDPADENGGFPIYQDAAEPGEDLYRRFYKEFDLTADFIEPCTTIDIAFPLQNHTVTPGNENLNITLNEYDNQDADLDEVRVQYRPIPGDGSWINILTLLPEDFATNPNNKVVEWDMIDLRDGTYEVRAIADCAGTIGGNLSPGISQVIRLNKETESPQLFGAPQPADGILTAGDEISITFNESINCDKVFDADGIGTNINLNNIALINTETGALVPFSSQCVGDKIIITPEVQSNFINGKILKAVATDVEDLAGNPMEVPLGAPGSPTVNFKEWEFLVDLNPLRWQAGSNIEQSIEEGTLTTITRNIVNKNGTAMAYTITGPRQDNLDGSVTYDDIPDWMIVSPTGGTLDPGEVKPITFVFPQDLVAEDYLSQINVVGTQGNNTINVDLRVVCPGPIWQINPTQYTYTMNMTLQLNIEGDISEDKMDRVGAFIVNADTGQEELRGWTFVQYEPTITPAPTVDNPNPEPGTYFAFLTLYSNEFSGEDIKLKIWDVSDCTLYGQVLEDFTYEADGLIGSPLEPQVVHTVNLISRTIPIHQGWNWISYNVDLPDASINTALESLTQPQNSLIKNQTDFSVYSEVNGGFTGSLTDMTHRTMYQYRSEAIDSLVLTGRPIDPDTVPIDILSGWNWIGFLPQQGMPVVDALSSLNPLNGDLIKSQIAFAQYVAGTGWIGNLNFMSSPNGYLLKISNDGTLVYPREFTGPAIVESRNSYEPHWELQPELYQYTMNMIGVVLDETNLLEDGDEVGAFYNNELRGVGQTIYIESLDAHVVFLTAYANEEGEELTFKFYDRSADEEMDLQEQFDFMANAIYGAVEAPEVWTLAGTSSTLNWATDDSFEVYPNPAKERVYLKFHNPVAERIVVRVTDALGREVERMETQAGIGDLTLEWIPSDLSEGLYFITLDRAESSVTRKVRITK